MSSLGTDFHHRQILKKSQESARSTVTPSLLLVEDRKQNSQSPPQATSNSESEMANQDQLSSEAIAKSQLSQVKMHAYHI